MNFIKRVTRANYYRKIFFDNKENIAGLFSILEDKESVETLNYLISSYCSYWYSPEYYYRKAASGICTEHHFVTDNGYEVKGVKNPYFLSEIFNLNKCEVFLDGGAYIGDTIETAQKSIPNLRLVYAFEPNKETYKKLIDNKRINGIGVKFFNKGLGMAEGKFRFKNDDAGSRINDEGSEVIKVLSAVEFVSSLSKDELPDFIKLDIEGVELDVIDSLAMYITRDKPDVAISIYHNLEDLWTIPLKLKLFCPEYHIYIRHQSNYYTETICYATTYSSKK